MRSLLDGGTGCPLSSDLSQNRIQNNNFELRTTTSDLSWNRIRLRTTCDLSQNRIQSNFFAELCSGSEAGSYSRLMDFCITRLWARGQYTRRMKIEKPGPRSGYFTGCRKSRSCSRDTYPESYIPKCTSVRRKILRSVPFSLGCGTGDLDPETCDPRFGCPFNFAFVQVFH